MSMVTVVTFSLSMLGMILLIWQFLAEKGTRPHIIRFFLILLSILIVGVVNTSHVILERGIIWDLPFTLHLIIGTGFFGCLVITGLLGGSIMKYSSKYDLRIIQHRHFAYLTAIYFFANIATAIWIAAVR